MYVLYLRTLEEGTTWREDDAKPTYIIRPRHEFDQMLNLRGESTDAFTRKVIAESDDEAELERFRKLTEEGA